MSRATLHDNSNAVSMFPFLAVLLCTMGALIVVLVCVTRLSREQALAELAAEEAAAEQPDEPDPGADAARRKLDDAAAYVAKLHEMRTRAQQQLTNDQSRLSHLEDHVRRLQDKMATVRLAAGELQAMEEVHFDDREQAQRELSRLEQLIEDSQTTVAELRAEAQSRPMAYAIVPYKGPNGTHRQPIYIECRRDEIILQPEGIRLTEEDFLPPLGPGNPLAAALRAAREQIRREASAAGNTEPADPYPLILVRPDGIPAYVDVRAAIESWDSDFGYEFVDGDWELKFPPANPQLAAIEYQAVETARARMRMLAAAAPRAYGSYRSARGGFALDDEAFDDAGDGHFGGGGDDASTGATSGGGYGNETNGGGVTAANEQAGGAGRHGTLGGGGGAEGESRGTAGNRELGGSSQLSQQAGSGGNATAQAADSVSTPGTTPGGLADDEPLAGRRGGSGTTAGGSASASANAAASNSAAASSGSGPMQQIAATPDDASAPNSVAMNMATQPPNSQMPPAKPMKTRGKDWAIRNPDPGAVPIRRTIQVIVRRDRLAILPESDGSAAAATGGREIPLSGPTDRLVEEFVSAVQTHVDEWGMAGQGLYWRPVLELKVGPDGGKRADDLVRLLNNSGLELQSAEVARQTEGEAARANR